MKSFILFALLAGLAGNAQNYTLRRVATAVNGNPGEMKGVPGDLFQATLTFSNTSASPISIFIDRYKKIMPAYWNSCFCYQSCNLPTRDTISIEVMPFSTTEITVQFKTDSVNPGLGISALKIWQWTFASITQTLELDASTLASDVGLSERKSGTQRLLLYPNPATENVNIQLTGEVLQTIVIFDLTGQNLLSVSGDILVESHSISLIALPPGVYDLALTTNLKSYRRRFVKL